MDQNTKLKLQTNVYEKCTSNARAFLKHTRLNSAQQRIIDCLHHMKNRVVLITGSAGIGKTKVLKFAVQPLIAAHLPILVCTPDNNIANNLVLQILFSTEYHFFIKNAIIIYMYSVITKKEAVGVTACQAGTFSNLINTKSCIGEAELLSIALMIYQAFHTTQECPHGLRDRRWKLYKISIAIWILRVAGIIDNKSPHSKANPILHKKFADFFRREVDGKLFNSRERTEYTLYLNNLCVHILNLADVVITMVSNSKDAALHGFYKPHLIVVDKANQVIEPDM